MDEQPSAAELVQAVAEFLEQDALPRLEGLAAFHARVAISVLGIVRRELEIGPHARAEELAGLKALLGRQGTAEELNSELCERIAGGGMSLATPGLLQHLMHSAMDKLAVDQPAYSTYRRLALETGRNVKPER
jgi:hypothetical protein